MVEQRSEGPLSVLELPGHLEQSYHRLVLVSDFDQALDQCDDNTLLVTSDWLAWRRLCDLGHHAVHFEAMLGSWPEELGDPDDHYLDASAWIYASGSDMTLFRGVSLGKQINRQISYLRAAYQRLWYALDRLCERYLPAEIVLHDIRVEADILDFDMIVDLVRDVAGKHGIEAGIHPDPRPRERPCYPIVSIRSAPVAVINRRLLRETYLLAVTALFRLRFMFSRRRPRVFLFLNWHCVRNLLENAAGHGITPVIQAEPWPKSLGFLWFCLRQGILQSRLPETRLNSKDKKSINAIIASLDEAWKDEPGGLEAAQRTHIRRHLIEHGWIWQRAREAKRYDLLMRNLKIDRAIVGDSENPTCRLIAETAIAHGIETDESPNGLYVSGQATDSRGPDRGGRNPVVARLLSWGDQNVRWLAATRATLPAVQTGYPGLDEFRKQLPPSRPTKREKALILPVTPTGDNPLALYSETFANVIAMARVLRDAGFTVLRLKLHPGYVGTRPYYQEVLDYHGIECEIRTDGELKDHALWADAVVGPINSGSLVETMMVGRPYYPFQSLPSTFRSELFGGAPVCHNAAELKAALDKDEPFPPHPVLQNLCSIDDYDSSSERVWQVMEETLCLKKSA